MIMGFYFSKAHHTTLLMNISNHTFLPPFHFCRLSTLQ